MNRSDCTTCRHVREVIAGESVRCHLYPDHRSYSWGIAKSAACVRHEPAPGADSSKDTNPKDGIGATKLPLHLVPASAVAFASIAHLNGALKYGAWNWRKAGVRASIYLDACRRHLSAWENGEECDPDDGVPHLAAALACINIVVDARACGKLTDDRPPAANLRQLALDLTPHVARLKELHRDRAPRHYTIADSEVIP